MYALLRIVRSLDRGVMLYWRGDNGPAAIPVRLFSGRSGVWPGNSDCVANKPPTCGDSDSDDATRKAVDPPNDAELYVGVHVLALMSAEPLIAKYACRSLLPRSSRCRSAVKIGRAESFAIARWWAASSALCEPICTLPVGAASTLSRVRWIAGRTCLAGTCTATRNRNFKPEQTLFWIQVHFDD